MSYIYTYDGTNPSINLAITSIGEILFYFKQTLKRAGWTVLRSSDGTTYSSNSDIITHAGSGAGGTENSIIWYVLKHPTSSRQLQVFRTVTNYNGGSTPSVGLFYSYSAGFTGGSPSATSRSTATDEKGALGNNGDIALAPVQIALVTSSNMRLHVVADNAAPYGWYMFWHDLGVSGSSPLGIWMMDPMLPGTYSSSDLDPYVFHCTGKSWRNPSGSYFDLQAGGTPAVWSGGMGVEGSHSVTPRGWYKKGASNESWVYYPAMAYTSAGGISIPGSTVINPYNGYDATFPIVYGRRTAWAAQIGVKGISSLAQWSGVARNVGDTLSIGGPNARDRIICGNLALPWNGSVPKI